MPSVRWISRADFDQYAEGSLGDPTHFEDMQAIRASIRTNRIWVDGETHHSETECFVPLVDEERVYSFSFRVWGELMADVWSGVDGEAYIYMNFYMETPPRPAAWSDSSSGRPVRDAIGPVHRPEDATQPAATPAHLDDQRWRSLSPPPKTQADSDPGWTRRPAWKAGEKRWTRHLVCGVELCITEKAREAQLHLDSPADSLSIGLLAARGPAMFVEAQRRAAEFMAAVADKLHSAPIGNPWCGDEE